VFASTQAMVNELCDEKRFRKGIESILGVRTFPDVIIKVKFTEGSERKSEMESMMGSSRYVPLPSVPGDFLITFFRLEVMNRIGELLTGFSCLPLVPCPLKQCSTTCMTLPANWP